MGIVRIPIDLAYPAPGSPGVNVWHAEIPDPIGTANLAANITALQAFYTAIAGLFPSTCTQTFAGVAVDVDTGQEYTSAPWTLSGSGGTSYAPLASAMVVSWRTGTALRSGVGRTFIGPLQGGAVDTDGTPSAVRLTALRNAAASLISTNQTNNPDGEGGLGVYSRTTGAHRQFVAARVRDQFAVLRSRRD